MVQATEMSEPGMAGRLPGRICQSVAKLIRYEKGDRFREILSAMLRFTLWLQEKPLEVLGGIMSQPCV